MSNPKNLVIVESPGKVKKIESFLGSDYKVMSSYGHIRDLKKNTLSVDVDKEFSPIYEIPEEKTALVNELRKAASKADTVWLASDEDREGEAIAWHLAEVLGLDPSQAKRIVFHEITKDALVNAIAHPRHIDMARVDAQQARRVLDRIVGFELSPVLWKRLKPSLSAGRVQSVAVRLIVEREMEIKNFKSEPYYRVTAHFTPLDKEGNATGSSFKADLHHRLRSAKAARELLQQAHAASFKVNTITKKPLTKSPAPPFTTSTLQQEASRKLGFTVAQTMMIAQRLYENGHITYMRTDSLNLSNEAINAISKQIESTLGKEYLQVRHYHTKSKGAQEAHEAIRPTYVDQEDIGDATAQEKKLYTLIRRRAIASQMADAEIEKTTVEIEASGVEEPFYAVGEVVKFDGFLRVYVENHDDETTEGESEFLPELEEGQALKYDRIEAIERFTQHPPRYTEGSLVKKMEELGIGRPATYGPTISTILNRQYIARGEKEGTPRDYLTLTLVDGNITEEERTELTGSEKGKFVPTDIGIIVTEFLTQNFPDILDYNFTANTEGRFDEIAQGNLKWDKEIGNFYDIFHPAVDKALVFTEGPRFGERILGNDPTTGEPVSVKIGRFGPVVQIGTSDSEEKPRFASLLKGQSIADITLEEALKLFEFPRTLGEFEGKEVVVGVGRFGPYVRHDGKFTSIPKDIAPGELTLESAIELIEEKRAKDSQKTILTFEEEPDMQVLNGRYGPYISYKKKNYKLPKSVVDPTALTLEEARKIVEEADAAPAKPKRTRKSKS